MPPFHSLAAHLRDDVARPHSSRQMPSWKAMLMVMAQPDQSSLHHLRSIQPPQKQKRHGSERWKASIGSCCLAASSAASISRSRSFIEVDDRSSRPGAALRGATTMRTSRPACRQTSTIAR